MIAQSCYLESCCILLLNLSICNAESTTALAHLNSVSQTFVIAGYSEQRSTANSLGLVEKERRRFSQDLHDEIGQGLIVLKLYLESLTKSYKEGKREGVLAKLEESMALVGECRTSVRRLTLDLGPAVLDQLGLLPSFKAYATQFSERTGIRVDVRADNIPQMPKLYQATLFRVLQGALSNVAQHSHAKRVQITARTVKGSIIKMTIADNGIGFVMAKHGFGITAMQERIEKLGGQFCLKSCQASSKSRRSGTTIEVSLPLSGCESTSDLAQFSTGTTEVAAGVMA
jgi:signal transduction histidine kinase